MSSLMVCSLSSLLYIQQCVSVIRPRLHSDPPDSPHHGPAIRAFRSVYGLPCHTRRDEGADGGPPSPSTCLSKIRAGSFLWPLILGFKATKDQAADRKHGHESPWGARHVIHILGPVFRWQSCHDITAKNKSFAGSAIVGFRFNGRYPDG